jgi:HSP20 family protein
MRAIHPEIKGIESIGGDLISVSGRPRWGGATSNRLEDPTMFRTLFPRDVFAELDRLQREMQQTFEISPSIRGLARGGFPAMNVGSTPRSVEIYAFAPGVDPASIDVQLEKGVLTIAGERKAVVPPKDEKATVHIDERFVGRFRRVVTLPGDVDPNAVEARYRDGVLHISVQRHEAAQPRRISIQ